MIYLFELVAWSRKRIDEIVSEGRDLISYYTIPEGPGGYPGLSSIAIGVYIKHVHGAGSIPHVRLYDVNRLAILSIANTVQECGLDGLVLLRGDKPVTGMIVEDVGTEEAYGMLRSKGYSFPIGMILSLNYPIDLVKERIRIGASFYHVINYSNGKHDKLVEAAEEAHKTGAHIYVFLLLGIGKNKKLFKKLGQPYVEPSELKNTISMLEGTVDGIALSSPLEPLEGLRQLRKTA